MAYDQTLYVSIYGSSSGTGSKEDPFLTIASATNAATGLDVQIIVDAGEFHISTLQALSKSGRKITYVGTGNTSTILVDNVNLGSYNGKVDVYGFKIKPSNTCTGDTRVIVYSSDSVVVNFYNCVFSKSDSGIIPTTSYMFTATSGTNDMGKYCYNCSFMDNIPVSWSGGITITNCALSSSSDAYATIKDCFFSAVFDSSFKLTNGDNTLYGVYSGEFQWGEKVLLISNGETYSILSSHYDSVNKVYTPLTNVTVDTIASDGFKMVELFEEINVDGETFKPIDKFTRFKIVCERNKSYTLNGIKSTRELLVGTDSFTTKIAENIDYFKLDDNASGTIRIVISIDNGTTWKTYDKTTNAFKDLTDITIPNKAYEDLSPVEILAWNSAKDIIFTEGMLAGELNTIDFNLLGASSIKFAYVLSATSASDLEYMQHLLWQFDSTGVMEECDKSEATFQAFYGGIKVVPKINADMMKVNITYEGVGGGGTASDVDIDRTEADIDSIINSMWGI